jgi:serine/threonine-protein kinase
MKCVSCEQPLEQDWRTCPKCGKPASQFSSIETVAEPISRPPTPVATPVSSTSQPRSSSRIKDRFAPGTIFAGRYQIISLLGRGGMGEVYRAEDLQLEQTVALKFLPHDLAADPRFAERFRNEVRIARQVSHPNVCRVYDIGESDGHLYLSMEFVQGEDLGSLLARIGRLPQEKALEMARKLCAGLAAAHDKGVLHRDLKPGNILVDGKGNLLITDFGLAAIAGEATDIKSGTPQYMAPEQLSGREVTAKSDIYSLGLVLYEMFTGKKAFTANTIAELQSLQYESRPASMSSLVGEVDPTIEKAIARCLEPEPRNRPSSPIAVSAALPGGDPLSAALAAGETPSPELVAASGRQTGLNPKIAIGLLAFTLVGLVASLWLGSQISVISQTPASYSPEVLKSKAQELAAKLNAPAYVDSASALNWNSSLIDYMRRQVKPERVREMISKGEPSLTFLWYRQSPRIFEPIRMAQPTRLGDPPFNISGMMTLIIDGKGRLESYQVYPPQMDSTPPGQPEPDWAPFFAAAGLDPNQMKLTDSKWVPASPFDFKRAWEGFWPAAPEIPIRVEAASWRGKPVHFAIYFPWDKPARMEPLQLTPQQQAAQWINIVINALVIVGGSLIAWWNWKRGRGDVQGARRLGIMIALFNFIAIFMGGMHWGSRDVLQHVFTAIAYTVFGGTLAFSLYLALEPFVRRRWPQLLVTWTRLFNGQWRDPFVASNLLAGIALAVFWALLFGIKSLVSQRNGQFPFPTWLTEGFRDIASAMFGQATNSILLGLSALLVLAIVKALVKRSWIAGGIIVLIGTGINIAISTNPVFDGAFALVQYGLGVFLLVRFGALPMVIAIYLSDLLRNTGSSLDGSQWHATPGVVISLICAAAAIVFFRWAVAGRQLLPDLD